MKDKQGDEHKNEQTAEDCKINSLILYYKSGM
jgi:hypothetical protein